MIEVKDIKQQVEERLTEKQKSKEFKDVGRVSGSKKEAAAYKIITMQNMDQIELDPVMAYKMVKKDSVFPKFEPIDQKTLGVDAGAAYLKVKIRESISARPKDNPLSRLAYVKFCEKLYNDLLGLKTINEIDALFDSYRQFTKREIVTYLIDPNSENASEDELLRILNTKMKEMRLYFGIRVNDLIAAVVGKTAQNIMFKQSDAAMANWREAKMYRAISAEEEAKRIQAIKESNERKVAKAKESLEKVRAMDSDQLFNFTRDFFVHPPTKTEWRTKEERRNEQYYRNLFEERFKKDIERAEAPIVLEKGEKAQEADWSWADIKATTRSKETTEADPNVIKLTINTKQPLNYIRRDNGYAIPDVSAINVVDYFGFRAINYGNYVNDTESKEHTRHLLGALSDMGEILNMNIKQLNQLGSLAMGIGLKGRPGALATYYPQTKDINLTKKNGDGSLCHEWGHYLDNAVAELGAIKATDNIYGSTGRANKTLTAIAFSKLMGAITKGIPNREFKITMRLEAERTGVYGISAARTPENPSGYVRVKHDPDKSLSEVVAEFGEYFVFDGANEDRTKRVFDTLKQLLHDYKVEEYAFNFHAKNVSHYYLKSRSMGSKYWIKEVELFARAFETYVYRQLQKQNRFSTYLVALEFEFLGFRAVYGDDFFNEKMPYPHGEEADYLDGLFDELIKTIKSDYGIGDFVPYSTERVSDLLQLENKDGVTTEGIEIKKTRSGKKKVVAIEEGKVVSEKEAVTTTPEPTPPTTPEQPVGQPEETMDIQSVIAGLEVLLEVTDESEKQSIQDVIEGLKLLV